ncbi:protein kinase [Alteromonas gracilis]|uniref:protein kinase domain-containing protein n=1 Tax=Alteromonas gracilis TaxID=1479524 RepID=UPI0037370EF6
MTNKRATLNSPTWSCPYSLSVSAHTSRGVKPINQDAYSFSLATCDKDRSSIFVIADGLSSSTVSQVASDFATSQFIKLYKIAPEQWSVKTCAESTIKEINALLYTRTQKSPFCYTPEKGYVCTFTVVILSGNQLDVFHVGDCEVQFISAGEENPSWLTRSHRCASDSPPSHSYLSRALGAIPNIKIDHISMSINAPSSIAMSSDGVHEFVSLSTIIKQVNNAESLCDNKAALVVHEAFNKGSDDNLTLVLIKLVLNKTANINNNVKRGLASNSSMHSCTDCNEVKEATAHKSDDYVLDPLTTGDEIDGIRLERQLYTSARSHVFVAAPPASAKADKNNAIVVKIPATDLAQTHESLNTFLIEGWFARRVNSPHVIKSPTINELGVTHCPSAYYSVSEYVKGQTLAQWVIDNPTPSLEQVRNIIEQIANGLQSLHRQGILHRDIRLENIIISAQGHCTIIDLGSAALKDAPSLYSNTTIPGTALFAAPEYFLGNVGTERSDLFSLAVLTYFLLCGRYPYQTRLAHCRTFAEQKKLKYETALDAQRPIPTWVDGTLKRALNVNPDKRHSALSEFVFSLRYPNPTQQNAYEPLVKRHPLFVYKVLLLALIFSNLVTLILFN